jgi:septum formation protein
VDHIILASANPQRAGLLAAAGFQFELMPVQIDETLDIEETPDGYARRVALLKALAAAERAAGRLVIAAKTIVLVGGDMLGKPHDGEDAKRMLRLLSGREHDVITAVCAVRGSRSQTRVDRTRVQFAPLTDEEVSWYAESGEPIQKAGAYAIHGIAARFVMRIEGSYSNAVGLPISVVYQMCRAI